MEILSVQLQLYLESILQLRALGNNYLWMCFSSYVLFLFLEDKTKIKEWLLEMAGLDGIKDIAELSKYKAFCKILKVSTESENTTSFLNISWRRDTFFSANLIISIYI